MIWSLTLKIYCGVKESETSASWFGQSEILTSATRPATSACNGHVSARWHQHFIHHVPAGVFQGKIWKKFCVFFSALRLQTYEKQSSSGRCTAGTPFWPRPLQPDSIYIPPGCTPPRLNLLPRLSKAACIHFKMLPLLLRATKKGLNLPPLSHTSAHTSLANVCDFQLSSTLTWLSLHLVKSLAAVAPLVVKPSHLTEAQLPSFAHKPIDMTPLCFIFNMYHHYKRIVTASCQRWRQWKGAFIVCCHRKLWISCEQQDGFSWNFLKVITKCTSTTD